MSAVEALHRDNDFRLLRTQEDPVANTSWCFMHATRFPRDSGYRACFSTLLIKEIRDFQKRVSDRLTLQSTNGDERIAQWVCERAGGFFINNPKAKPHPFQLIPSTNSIVQEFADMLGVIAVAAADNQITKDEAKAIRRRWEDLKSVTEGFVRNCEEGNFNKLKDQTDKTTKAGA